MYVCNCNGIREREVRAAIAQQAGVNSDQVAYSLIGASWGSQITERALIALVVFLVLVGLVIWVYFRNGTMSIAALVRGSRSAMTSTAVSINISADASSGSKKPAERPTATQLRCQKDSRCPELMGIRRVERVSAAGPT